MITVNIHQAKATLSELIHAVERGERIAEGFRQMVVEYIDSHYRKARDAA